MDLFNKEYVGQLLLPFVGKNLRIDNTFVNNKDISIPFILESNIESPFQIELSNIGVRFVLKDNYYIKKDINENIRKAFNELKVYPHVLNRLINTEDEPDSIDFINSITKHLQENFNPQIAFTYYTFINSIEVSNKYFIINGIRFFVVK
jgi:hypothetical protein